MNPVSQTPSEIRKKSKSNFASSFFFLAPEKRRAIEAIYAFSRIIDDAVDESASREEAEGKLSFWKQELEKAYENSAHHPVMQDISWAASRFQIPKVYFDELMEGVAQDLTQNRYQTFKELCQYTYRVASVVGLICMKIFGVEGEKAEKGAILLGRALQLTNILRDLKSDAIRGRIYLPLQDLHQFSLTEEEFLQGRNSVRLDSLMHYEIGQTEAVYREAFGILKILPRRPLLAAWIMGKIYYQILKEIKKNPRKPLQQKIELSTPTKIKIVLAECAKSWF